MNPASGRARVRTSSNDLIAVIERWSISAAAETFNRTLPWLRRLARRHAPSLPTDLHDEIVHETWQLVFARGSEAFLASEVDADRYLAMVLRNAVEVVRTSYRPAGTKSRGAPAVHGAVEFSDGVENWASKIWFQVEQAEVDLRLDLERAAASLGGQVASALALMVNEGLSVTDAAAGVGMSRQTLSRRLISLRRAA